MNRFLNNLTNNTLINIEADTNEEKQELLSYQETSKAKSLIDNIIENVETVIMGKRTPVELTILSLISGGHVLIEDIPGVGKTSLVSSLSKSIACSFKRIQFTPDVMPSDITGFSIYNQKTGEFEFRQGAAMSNIILADEINRASAKTQASLLEIMEEKQVTVDSETYHMSEPFMVLATQNPIDYLGTYPLPEAQIDRFLCKLSMGYPSIDEEIRIVATCKKAKTELHAVANADDILWLRQCSEQIFVKHSIIKYIVEIVNATRVHNELKLGSSPRGCISLYNLCKTYALYQGRNYVIPDDIKYLTPYVLCHRISLNHDAKNNKRSEKQIIDSILNSILIPTV